MTRDQALLILGLEPLGDVEPAALTKAAAERSRVLLPVVHPDRHPGNRSADHLFRLITDARDALDHTRPHPAPAAPVPTPDPNFGSPWATIGEFFGGIARGFVDAPTGGGKPRRRRA